MFLGLCSEPELDFQYLIAIPQSSSKNISTRDHICACSKRNLAFR